MITLRRGKQHYETSLQASFDKIEFEFGSDLIVLLVPSLVSGWKNQVLFGNDRSDVSSNPRKKKKKNDTEIVTKPYEATNHNGNFQQLILNNNLQQVIPENVDNNQAFGFHSLSQEKISDVVTKHTPSTTRRAKNVALDATLYFNKLFAPLKEDLLKNMNNLRELRIVERNKPKVSKGRGRPNKHPHDGQHSDTYKYSFTKPFTNDDLLRFLACFFQITTINASEMSIYWSDPTSNSPGHGLWFKRRISQRMYDEMFRCLDIDHS